MPEAQQRLTKPKSQQQISYSKENSSILRRPILVRKKHKVKKNRSEVNLTNIKLSSANDNPKKVSSFFKPKAKTGDKMMPKNTHTPPEKKSTDEEVPAVRPRH